MNQEKALVRGLLRDYEPSDGPSFQALHTTHSTGRRVSPRRVAGRGLLLRRGRRLCPRPARHRGRQRGRRLRGRRGRRRRSSGRVRRSAEEVEAETLGGHLVKVRDSKEISSTIIIKHVDIFSVWCDCVETLLLLLPL